MIPTARPSGPRSSKYGDVATLLGTTLLRSGSEKTIFTIAVRDTSSMPGGGEMDTICGGPPSRINGWISLSLPFGPLRRSRCARHRLTVRGLGGDGKCGACRQRTKTIGTVRAGGHHQLTAPIFEDHDGLGLGHKGRRVSAIDVTRYRRVDNPVRRYGRTERHNHVDHVVVKLENGSIPTADAKLRCRSRHGEGACRHRDKTHGAVGPGFRWEPPATG